MKRKRFWKSGLGVWRLMVHLHCHWIRDSKSYVNYVTLRTIYAHCGNCICSAYCGCSELTFGIASMGKGPDLDTIDRGQIVGAWRMGYSIIRQLGVFRSTMSRVHRANCEGQH
ncbi:hypothetical protein TNCV_531031 [Trichonephila clavipes]|nr:hypothetical protein TNCV_531031 [Trichonephila clavipes]